jgi:uncharacterized membrane protein YhiD involved in acid resistance
MRQEFQDFFIFELTMQEAIANLLIALMCGLLIAVLYKVTYRGLSYSANFFNSIILLTMITALVIMVIGNNIARAFGLVGAMSIIRFRTAVKDPQDIMFIFFALGIGLASGAGMYAITLTGTILIGLAFFITARWNHDNPTKKELLLQVVSTHDPADEKAFNEALAAYCKDYKVVNVKAGCETQLGLLESSFYIKLQNEAHSQKLVRQIRDLKAVKSVNLFFDEQ